MNGNRKQKRSNTSRRTVLKGTAAAVGVGALSTGSTAGTPENENSGSEPAEAADRQGPQTGRPPARGERGMVATSHWLASEAGLNALRSGGSAVDAAIAANAVLSVAYPHMAGLGGDGFWLIHDGDDVRALNASGPAAADATRDRYAEYEELPDRGAESAITVPGAVDGWRQAHDCYGTLAWEELFADAIYHAREGVPVGHSLADWLEIDEPILNEYPETAEIFLPNGQRPEEGDRLVQSALADSLETIATDGARDGFYEGPLAEELASPAGSPLSPTDFANFEAEWVDPISTTYRGYTAYNFPPNTQGFAALQVLNLLEGFDVESWDDNTADYYHHMAEAVKVAFADRDEWLTDPDAVDIPLDTLLSKDYADDRRQLIDSETAMEMADVEPGIEFSQADRDVPGGDTVYLSVVDEDGLAVSLIQSVYYDFGSAVVGGDSGIILQNRGSFFSLDADHPNRLEPGKRTFHTLIPAILCQNGEPYLCYGTMGGEGQPQTQAAMVTRLVDFGYDVQQAIEAPRWLMGPTWGTDTRDLSLEGRIDDAVVDDLAARGQPTTVLDDWDDNMGHAQAIRIDPETGYLEGGADPRGDGTAQGF